MAIVPFMKLTFPWAYYNHKASKKHFQGLAKTIAMGWRISFVTACACSNTTFPPETFSVEVALSSKPWVIAVEKELVQVLLQVIQAGMYFF